MNSNQTFDSSNQGSPEASNSVAWVFSQSSNLHQFQQFQPFADQLEDDKKDNLLDNSRNKKAKKKHKKRPKKFDRMSKRDAGDDERDVKKYAKFDTMNEIYAKFTDKKGILWTKFQQLVKLHKLCKRSMKYIFISLGVLQQEKELSRYYDFFNLYSSDTIELKYGHKSLQFKRHLTKVIKDNKLAISHLIQGNYEFGIRVGYTGNELGENGKTKNPTEMEKCLRLYQNIFSMDFRSNQYDLDILLI